MRLLLFLALIVSCGKVAPTSKLKVDTTYNKYKICNKTDVSIKGAIGLYTEGSTNNGWRGITKGFITIPKAECVSVSGMVSDSRLLSPSGNWYFSTSHGQLIPDNSIFYEDTDSIMCVPNSGDNMKVITGTVPSKNGKPQNSISCSNDKFAWGVEIKYTVEDSLPNHFVHVFNIKDGDVITKDGSRQKLSIVKGGSQVDKTLAKTKLTIDKVKKDLELSDEELEDLKEIIGPYLNIDIEEIDLDNLPDNVPAWFKDYVAKLKRDLKAQEEALEKVKLDQEAEAEQIQKDIEGILEGEGIEIDDFEIENMLDESLDSFDDISDPQNDYEGDFAERTTYYTQMFEGLYSENNRLEFLKQVYLWIEES